jgi:hypothetical protein
MIADPRAACHAMLLRLAGRLPDEYLAEARHWLAIDRLDYLARTVPVAARTLQVPLADADVEVVRDLSERYGLDPAILADVDTRAIVPAPDHRFSAVPLVGAGRRPAEATGARYPASGTGTDDADAVDEAVIGVASATDGVRTAARSLRYPLDDRLWMIPPKRVYLIGTDAGIEPYLLTLDLQAAMAGAGEPDPQAEVFEETAELPAYQRRAVEHAVVLWSRNR